MFTLAINTASSSTGIALLKESQLLSEKSWPAANKEAEKLMPQIANLCQENSVALEDIAKVICVSGPGSFTGLRVGVTVANTIAYLNKAELYAIPSFDYYWKASESLTENDTILSFNPEKAALLVYAGSKGVYLHRQLDSVENNTSNLVIYPDQTTKSPKSQKSPGTKFEETPIINIDQLAQYLKDQGIQTTFGDISPEQKQAISATTFLEISQTFGQIIASFTRSATTIPESTTTESTAQNTTPTPSATTLTNFLQSQPIITPTYIKPPGITQPKTPAQT